MHDLLVKTSRTFALAIPLLPEPTRNKVCLAYLLFRIADTLEDADQWPREARLAALDDFAALLEHPSPEAARRVRDSWRSPAPVTHEGYLELLSALPDVMAEVALLDPPSQRIVLDHALRTAAGMREVVAASGEGGRLCLETLEGLRQYCYVVAGIVGELLTALFVQDWPPVARVRETLRGTERAFGEGLQLVNILKDQGQDAANGRAYLPPAVPRATVLDLAREDLRQARRYVDALRGTSAPPGLAAFTSLSERLAEATLDRLEREGPGAKISRAQVFEILAGVQAEAAGAAPEG